MTLIGTKIHIQHAWGGKNLPGVYYNACISNNTNPLPLTDANVQAPKFKMKPFEFVCYDLLSRTKANLKPAYDYLLLDEGQDFPRTFYWLCRKLVKNDRLIWAYDELQNILNIEIQETMQLFNNEFGDEGINLEELAQHHPHQNNDIVLHKSYRNPREILLISHALGFGVYNDKMVQRLEDKDHWIDLGYDVQLGNCQEGEQTIIHRPEQNSPSIISNHYKMNEIITTYVADNFNEEVEWVTKSIINDIQKDKLLPEDVMVICLDDRNARRYFSTLSSILAKENIYVNNVLESYGGDTFILPNKTTLTSVYRAKGNEAAMVYIIGADSLINGRYDIVSRNKIFTAFTRAKAWIKFSGVGKHFDYIINEINVAKEKFPNLEFTYPGSEEIKTLRRELAKENEKKNRDLAALMDTLDGGGFDRETALKLLQGENKK
ncbi:ATP-binding domain-containing protein [Bacillus cereus]